MAVYKINEKGGKSTQSNELESSYGGRIKIKRTRKIVRKTDQGDKLSIFSQSEKVSDPAGNYNNNKLTMAAPALTPDQISLQVWMVILGCGSNQVAEVIIRQGIDSIAGLAQIDPDDVETLCNSARKPGGMIRLAPTLPPIPNPGVQVPAMFESRLTLSVIAAKYYLEVDRPITPGVLQYTRTQHFKQLKIINENWKDPEPLPSLSRSIPIMRMIELIRGYLRKILGVRKIPLSYVVRTNVAVPPIADSPLRPLPNNLPYGAPYRGFHDELIIRASHEHPGYDEDNALVLDIIIGCLQATSHMSSIKQWVRTRDGRQALLSLEGHNMGKDKWKSEVMRAETAVLRTTFNGKNPRFTLRHHICTHRDAHVDMTRASEADGFTYQIPDEATRVQRLITSIQCSDPRVVAALANIQGHPQRENDFEAAAEYLLQVAPPRHNNNNNSNGGGGGETTHRVSMVGTDGKVYQVSAVVTGKSTGYKPAQMGKTGIELRYYKRAVYHKFTDAQKQELTEWRRQHEANKKRDREEGGEHPDTKKYNSLKSQVSALQSELKKMRKTVESARDDEDTSETTTTTPKSILRKPPARMSQAP